MQRIDEICLRFEDELRTGLSPSIEAFLEDSPSFAKAVLFEELVLIDLDYRRRFGDDPGEAEYRSRFPLHADVVAEIFSRRRSAPPIPVYRPGQRIDRYVIREELDSGAFGTVYVAWDEYLARVVAIKVPHPELLKTPKEKQRIIEEARAAAKLQHPAIVSIFDVVADSADNPCIVMEHCPGITLRQRINSARFSIDETLSLVIRLAETVDFAHRHGFVHRDLEPSNIVLDGEGNPRILDFGLAIHESNQSQRVGESAGSLAYMSPELVLGRSHWLDGRADIWALGVILYELLSGRRPFTHDDPEQLSVEILHREPKPLRQIEPDTPMEVERICSK
jgi:serine/threonine protein kinase